jgi:hypothetical protein
MTASTITELKQSQLLKMVLNPLQRDEALAEIDRRKQVTIDLNAIAIASAMPVITAFLGEGITTRQMAEAYVSIKEIKPTGWYKGATTPEPLVSLRNALHTVLKSEGISLESHALQQWFANN